jgi:hypothetical protein
MNFNQSYPDEIFNLSCPDGYEDIQDRRFPRYQELKEN